MPDKAIGAKTAGAVIGLSDQAIRDHVTAGRLRAQRVGVRNVYRIRIADIKAFAEQYNYPVDEELVRELER